MLILERGYQQSIIVGDDIVITVFDVVGNSVRIGFSAPAEVSIDREEVWLRKQDNDQRGDY